MKKVIVITGSSSGFGYLMAQAFSYSGYSVVATMRDVAGKNADAAKYLKTFPNIEVLELDITQEGSVKAAVDQIINRHEKIDVLVNNAGVYGSGLLEGYSLDQFKKIFEVNVYGTLRVTNAVLPGMRKAKDGLIINISSGLGRMSSPFNVPYNASKFALEGIVEGSYLELIGQGIENVLIEPGPFPTSLWAQAGINADRNEITEAYGDSTKEMMQGFSGMFEAAMGKVKPDPQVVVDAALGLISAEKGKRALRTPLDLISNGIDKELDSAIAEIKGRILNAYGF